MPKLKEAGSELGAGGWLVRAECSRVREVSDVSNCGLVSDILDNTALRPERCHPGQIEGR